MMTLDEAGVQSWADWQKRYGERMADLWDRAGIPARYHGMTLGNSVVSISSQRDARDACHAWLDGFDHQAPWGYPGLLLHGLRGSGKTHWACCILATVLNRLVGVRPYVPVRFVVAANLMGRIAEARRPHSLDEPHESAEDVFGEMGTCRLLVVDDLGNELHTWGQQEQAHWYRIVNDRYNNRLPMIITTNALPEDLWRHVGPAAASRLQEMVRLVEVQGSDLRAEAP